MTWKAFLGHFQCEDHPGHAIPDLPRPLARLWFHPCLISAEKQFQISGSIMAWVFFYIISQKDSHFLVKLGAFLGHFQLKIILAMLFPTYHDPLPAYGSILAWSVLRKLFQYSGSKTRRVFFTYILSLKDRCFLLKLGAFLGHFLCEAHLGHGVPNLPRPLANLWRHPGQRTEEKPAV